MALHTIAKGLDLPIAGCPEQKISAAPGVHRVALMADDYRVQRWVVCVAQGDVVKRGQAILTADEVACVAPGAGTVAAIHTDAQGAVRSVVIELSEQERAGNPGIEERVVFRAFTGRVIAGLNRVQITALLLESGLWTAFRTRPFGRVPDPSCPPHSMFVTAMDTNPLAASPEIALNGKEEEFHIGLQCVVKLSGGEIYLCKAPGSRIAVGPHDGVSVEEFEGPHPAGTVGLHIHALDPVRRDKSVWHIGYQDVIAMGALFMTGQLDVERVVSIAGPGVKRPRLTRTRLGVSTDELTAGALHAGEQRVISGPLWSGRQAMGDITGYLGRYHTQISVLPEGHERPTILAGRVGSALPFLRKERPFTTALHGVPCSSPPMGSYDRVMPMDVPIGPLLRALARGDFQRAEWLGCLELDEEDLALCAFVCPCKHEYGIL